MTLERVAVLSDIHGVLPALEAVLAEPDVRAADAVVLAGDLLAGPQPVETLGLLRDLGDRAVWISGNADRELVELARGDAGRPGAGPLPMDAWAARQLGTADIGFLAGLPPTARLEVAGLGPVLFCHATPRDDAEVVLVDSRPARWAEVLADVDADVRAVVCGHTHMPFVRLTHGLLVVNPGSVGMPYGRPGAHWALLGPGDSMTLRRTVYDYAAACARIAAESAFEGAAEWAEEYVHARNSAEDALAAFGPLDGRAR
ncbi:phosphoesterase [Streptomyces abyssalis]|uniref:Phosphoesterase n=1 Tax=Streptomyces abyssalis TaxID=933944 RepID=A0A1E7JUV9_9ACTN|nr:metallophosphoesterase family protein [Streptomyces abyssalis]OEU89280.1 phosphoesterase [Streptomyces abyssalis]OEU93748.1 phosphoesterase [Streptomyces abyssalis]OEV29361.1 phosphoesterase [Streptomyces nanshensis]